MKKTSILIAGFALMLNATSSVSLADDSAPAGSKVAGCLAAADASNPEETMTLFFKGGDASDIGQYAIHYANGSSNSDFPVQALQWTDGGETLELRFGNYFVATIHSGESNDSTIGVMLGAAPRSMTCDANFDGLVGGGRLP